MICDIIISQNERKIKERGEVVRDYLRKIRETKKMTQEDLAKKIGMSPSAYTMIELGQRQKKMTVSMAVKLSKALGVSKEKIIA